LREKKSDRDFGQNIIFYFTGDRSWCRWYKKSLFLVFGRVQINTIFKGIPTSIYV